MTQWGSYQEGKAQLQQWMDTVEQEVEVALPQQPGLKEKVSLLERLRAIEADTDSHSATLSRLNEKATELFEKTGDQAFAEDLREDLSAQFSDITVVIKVNLMALLFCYVSVMLSYAVLKFLVDPHH